MKMSMFLRYFWRKDGRGVMGDGARKWEGMQIINKQDYIIDFIRTLQFVLSAMKRNTNETMNFVSYLDVSEFIIKEPSPLLQPSPAQHDHHEILSPEDHFELQSVEANASEIILTPVTSGLIRLEVQDIMEDFMLEGEEGLCWGEVEPRRRRGDKMHMHKNSTLQLFRMQSDLDRIVEYDHEQSYVSQLSSCYSCYSERPLDDDHCGVNSNTFFTVWSKKEELKESSSKDIQMQYQTTVEPSNVDYTETISKFNANPRHQIMAKISEIEGLSQATDLSEKQSLLRKYLENYLLEYETYCYGEAWRELEFCFQETFQLIREGIDETFSKRIGSLSFESRRVKLLKYLEKKRRRIWRKKVSYDCRKKVADGRLRIKGKFVTREQACEQLGLESLDNFNADQIKEMLQRKMDDNLKQPSC